MEQRPLGLEVEALDVEHPAVRGRHHDRDALRARALAQQHLDLEPVALVDRPRRRRPGTRRRRLLDPAREQLHVHVGVELGDLARREHDLADADVGDAARDPVQVRQVEHVEVREPELAADALVHQGRHDRATDGQPRDGDLSRQPVLLGRGDRVAVAVEAQLAVQLLRQDVDERAAPRVVEPHALALDRHDRVAVARRPAARQLLDLRRQLVDHRDRRIVAVVRGVDDQRAVGLRVAAHGRGLSPAGVRDSLRHLDAHLHAGVDRADVLERPGLAEGLGEREALLRGRRRAGAASRASRCAARRPASTSRRPCRPS